MPVADATCVNQSSSSAATTAADVIAAIDARLATYMIDHVQPILVGSLDAIPSAKELHAAVTSYSRNMQ